MTRAAASRKLLRRVAALILTAMAEADMSVEQIAEKLDTAPGPLSVVLHGLIDGEDVTMSFVAEVLWACGFSASFNLHPNANAEPVATAPADEMPT